MLSQFKFSFGKYQRITERRIKRGKQLLFTSLIQVIQLTYDYHRIP